MNLHLPDVGLRLVARDDGIPRGLVNPSPRRPNRDDTGNAGCPSMENAPGRWARCANGSADIPAPNGEAPGKKNIIKHFFFQILYTQLLILINNQSVSQLVSFLKGNMQPGNFKNYTSTKQAKYKLTMMAVSHSTLPRKVAIAYFHPSITNITGKKVLDKTHPVFFIK